MGLREQRAKVTLCRSVVQQAFNAFVNNATLPNQTTLEKACENLVYHNQILANMGTKEITPEREEVS